LPKNACALNLRTGRGETTSNLRIVTLLIAPASCDAARSPHGDSMILLVTTHLR
jgi:hypothetical protein